MHLPLTLILRPGRAAFLAAAVAAPAALHGAVVLGSGAPAEPVGGALLLLALAGSAIALGTLRPLVGRGAGIGLRAARAGLAATLLVEAGWLAFGSVPPAWALAPAATVTAAGLWLLRGGARRAGEPHAWCLPLLLVATTLGVPLAPWGGLVLLGGAWLATAVSVWSAYAVPLRAAPAS